MGENDTHSAESDASVSTDGGTLSQAAQTHRNTNYLDEEVNLLNPSTAFMRDHLRVVWTSFLVWALVVFGPVTATVFAPEMMTATMPVLGFPWHYFLVAFGAPTGALILAAVYARQRDTLDSKYGIDPSNVADADTDEHNTSDTAATDGGVDR